MYINGEWRESASTFLSYNPATGEALGPVAECSTEHTRSAIEAAHTAFASWRHTTAHSRSALLYRTWQLMKERQEELAQLMTAEQGKPLKAARNEVGYAADFLLWFAEEAKRNYGETIPSARADQRFIVSHAPVGVVAAVTPWNYPISMLTRKLAPALAAGCTVVLKPAEATSLCAIAVFKLLEEAGFPAGVVNLLTCSEPRAIGEVFCTDPRVKKLTFTGSTAVGKQLATACAPSLKRVSMELGGNAPFIVFDDADPVRAAKGCALVKFLNTGQACISPNRILVHHKSHDSFVQTLQSRIEAMVPGNGKDPATTIGPLINSAAVEKMQRQVEDALSKGATLICGGHKLDGEQFSQGHYYAPTLITDVTQDMLIAQEETFGPIAAVMRYDDESDLMQIANNTHYGLAAYIYTRDISRALLSMEQLDFGIVGINDINPTSAAAPFGGMNASGLGREGAREGMSEYLETRLAGLSL